MTAYFSWNLFVTDDNKVLRSVVASSLLFITLITKELLFGKRYFIGWTLNYAGSFVDDLLAMSVRRKEKGG